MLLGCGEEGDPSMREPEAPPAAGPADTGSRRRHEAQSTLAARGAADELHRELRRLEPGTAPRGTHRYQRLVAERLLLLKRLARGVPA